MIVKLIPFQPPKHDPYDECVTGSHDGEAIEIDCGHGLTLLVQEMRSGIGPSFYVHAIANGEKRGRFYAFIDDDGDFCSGFEERHEQIK